VSLFDFNLPKILHLPATGTTGRFTFFASVRKKVAALKLAMFFVL